jgi:hypothetical protein
MTQRCPICGSISKSIKHPEVAIGHRFFSECELGLALCLKCRVRFISPRPPQATLDAFYCSPGYDCHDTSFGSDGDVRLDIIERTHPKGLLCDFGAGAGRLLGSARQRGWRVCGVEPGSSRQTLQTKGFEVVMRLSDLKVEPDVITMVHVLEHLNSPVESLREIRSSLTSSGLVYIEVPNADSLRARLANSPLKPLWTHAAERYLAFPIHLFYFNASSLTGLLDQTGFTILEMGTLGMGVEELFQPKPQSPTRSDTTTKQTTKPVRSSFRFLKQIIKRSFSKHQLGENLFVVAKIRD